MSRIDFKNGHREIVNRRADRPEGMDMYSWQDGWSKVEYWMHGFLWGIVALIALIVFL